MILGDTTNPLLEKLIEKDYVNLQMDTTWENVEGMVIDMWASMHASNNQSLLIPTNHFQIILLTIL